MGSTTSSHRSRAAGADVALVARLHAGDRDAFDQLYRTYRPGLTRWVAAQMHGRDHAAVDDDCVHDAFCAALADPTRIGADVRGSLRRLAARACRAHRPTPGQVRITDLVYVEANATVDDDLAGESTQPVQRRAWIGHALDRLGDEHRRVIELRYLHGHPQAVVAALMDRPVAVVQILHRQALRHLRAQLTAAAATDVGMSVPV